MTHQTLSLEKYWKLFPVTLMLTRLQISGTLDPRTITDDACWRIIRLAPSLDLMLSSGRLSLDSKYISLIVRLPVRVNPRTEFRRM